MEQEYLQKTPSSTHFTQKEVSNYRQENLKLTLQGDEEDLHIFENCSIELVNTRFFIETSQNSSFHTYYWNCISIGKTSSTILIMISDVVKNERFEQNPQLYEEEEVKSRDSVFEKIVEQEPGTIELIGEYTLNIESETEEDKNKLFTFLNKCSSKCPDPEELTNLINPEEQDLTDQVDFAGFQGGENWNEMLQKMGVSKGDLGKRQLEVFDLEAELERMRAEEADEESEIEERNAKKLKTE